MAQSFDVSGPQGSGRAFGRRPIVLARLPRVDAGARTIAMKPPAPPALTFAEATRFYVDPHHAKGAAQTEQPQPQRSATDHRRHHDSHRQSSQLAQSALAASLPVKVASYSGFVMTLVLAASVAILYWMIVKPTQAPPADFANSYDTFGDTKIEIPYFEVATPPAGPPKVAAQEKTPAVVADSFPNNEAPVAEATSPAADLASPAVGEAQLAQPAPTFTAAAAEVENQPAVAAPTPPIQPANDLVPLPEIIPAPTTTPQVIYNDSSAAAYPTTDHPLASHITVLGISALGPPEPAPRDAGPNDGAKFFSVPQMARQPESNLIQR